MRFVCLFVLSLLVFGLNCSLAVGQDTPTGRVEGRVVTAEAGAPLADATVGINGNDRPTGTVTGADGRFVLPDLPPGRKTLQVRHVGYVTTTRTVRVRSGETTRITVELESATVELAGLEITGATRSARAALPGAASKVDAAALEQMDPIGTQAALKHVPGVYGLTDDGMTQTRMSVGIRGLQPRRTQRVLVMEDGMPIQPAPYVFSPLYYNPPIERIEEIEVVKGPSTIRHGPQTMAGVINYVTSRPQRRSPGGTVELTPGTNGYLSAFGELGGFDYFIYGAEFPVSLVRPQTVIVSGFPADWWQHYQDQGYIAVDPVVQHTTQRNTTPLIWQDIEPAATPFPESAERFMREAHDFGLASGVSFPVHGQLGESAIFSLVSSWPHPRVSAHIVRAMPYGQLLAGYVHEAARRVFSSTEIALGRTELTARERECLLWAAEGKTTWDTAKILGIAERTVVFHLQNAARKLDVSNRAQAVARAVAQGYITPQFR